MQHGIVTDGLLPFQFIDQFLTQHVIDGAPVVVTALSDGRFAVTAIQPGDVLLFRYDNQPQHVALATDTDRMIHSFAVAGEVVETIIGDYWQRRLNGIYRF